MDGPCRKDRMTTSRTITSAVTARAVALTMSAAPAYAQSSVNQINFHFHSSAENIAKATKAKDSHTEHGVNVFFNDFDALVRYGEYHLPAAADQADFRFAMSHLLSALYVTRLATSAPPNRTSPTPRTSSSTCPSPYRAGGRRARSHDHTEVTACSGRRRGYPYPVRRPCLCHRCQSAGVQPAPSEHEHARQRDEPIRAADRGLEKKAKLRQVDSIKSLARPDGVIVKDLTAFEHEVRTEHWSGAYSGNVEAMAAAVAAVRVHFQQLLKSATVIDQWQDVLYKDLKVMANTGQTLQDDLSEQNN